jgi:DNA-binding HxlR family transcriptional regulator
VAKTYGQFCSVAHALDAVGDRWALLVVRELLLGPCRYTDLLSALPGVATNVLSTRLRELEAAGIVQRRRLPPPTPAMLYELTDDGEDLRDVVDALARWGTRRLTSPTADEAVEARWLVLNLAANLDANQLDGSHGTTYELHIDEDTFTLATDRGVAARRGPAHPPPTATLTGDLRSFFAASKGDRTAARRIAVSGDIPAGRRLLAAITHSDPTDRPTRLPKDSGMTTA